MTYSEVAVAQYSSINNSFDKPRAYSIPGGTDWADRFIGKANSSTLYGSHKPESMEKNDQHDHTRSRMLDEQARIQRLGRGSVDAAIRPGSEEDAARRSSYGSTVEQYRRASMLHSRSPSIGEHALGSALSTPMSQAPRSAPRQAPYGYYPEDSPQYGSQNLSNTTLGYSSDYSTSDTMQRQGSYPTYPSNMVYNVAQQSQNTGYEQSYAPRPPAAAAIEVLSSQFSGVPPYYSSETAPQTTSSASHQQSPGQFSGVQYPRQPTLSSQYVSNIPSMSTPSVPEESYDNSLLYGLSGTNNTTTTNTTTQNQAMEDAYEAYQNALRTTFANTLQGRLGEAGESLLSISDWLLSNIVDLGLAKDEPELYNDRAVMWTEFNMCWLSALNRQKEIMADYLSTTAPTQPPQDYLKEDQLEKMGRELIRLCDNMERHGLVDYEMGVWEEQILEVLQDCLDQLEAHLTSGQRSLEQASSSKHTSDWKAEPVTQ